MSTSTESLRRLENQALQHLRSVDLALPMAQLQAVLEALLEVPTHTRRSDTAFARQAMGALDILLEHTRKLSAFVDLLTDHVGTTMIPATPHGFLCDSMHDSSEIY